MPKKPRILWKTPLGSLGLGGIAATTEYVITSERGLNNSFDVFRCLRADNGAEVWALRYPAAGELDYGSSPRSTPLIVDDLVYLYGAFGHLHCVELKTGVIVWEMDVKETFKVEAKLAWGLCGSPLLVDDKLILSPGAADASLVALEPRTGKVIWKTPGEPASYGSLNVGTFGGRKQIVGHDATTLGGWDVATGKRLWTMKPKKENDYNVATPIIYGEQLLVTTENNGTRLYSFDKEGILVQTPVAVNMELAPETHTPVVVGQHLFGIWKDMYCLDMNGQLKARWMQEDDAFVAHTSIIACKDRLLITTSESEVLLVQVDANKFKLLGRMKVFDDEKGLYSHPALVGNRLYLRGSNAIVAVDLNTN